jgi:hypothetical protein
MGAETPIDSRNFSYPLNQYLTMLRALPIYNPMSTILQDYERVLAIIHNPKNRDWHKPSIVNTIKAFVVKHETKSNEKVLHEIRQYLLVQINND